MKNLKIQVPEGYEIDKEKSTFEEIIFKKKASELPTSVDEIKDRYYYIDEKGVIDSSNYEIDLNRNNVSTKERAEAFLALMQLVELRDAWNEASEEDWDTGGRKAVILIFDGEVSVNNFKFKRFVLNFKTDQLRDQFLVQFRDLIETAKELI